MKKSAIVFVSLLLIAGCSTERSVAKLEGRGTSQVFDAGYDPVWHAAVAAMQMNDLRILETDKVSGYISAKRQMSVTTFGEHVGVWVRELNPQQAEVEVVSRRAGPPVSLPVHSEERVLNTIATILPSPEPSAVLDGVRSKSLPQPENAIILDSQPSRLREVSSGSSH
jgi:hypothetical protein